LPVSYQEEFSSGWDTKLLECLKRLWRCHYQRCGWRNMCQEWCRQN